MFQDENTLADVSSTKFKVGISNEDPGGTPVETAVKLSVPAGRANWLYYDIAIGCLLDSGICVHRALPQVDNTWDTLGSCDIADPSIDQLTGRGVNNVSNDVYQDLVQRMAHSQYWFRLWGQAMRIGEQVPIPMLKSIAGVDAIPHDNNPQWAVNKIAGNYSGQVLWHAYWSLWYTIASAPTKDQAPPQNLAQHTDGTSSSEMQTPWSKPDEDAESISIRNKTS